MIATVGFFAPSPADGAVLTAHIEDNVADADNVYVGANVVGELGVITRE